LRLGLRLGLGSPGWLLKPLWGTVIRHSGVTKNLCGARALPANPNPALTLSLWFLSR
jgi:hypothetical protein